MIKRTKTTSIHQWMKVWWYSHIWIRMFLLQYLQYVYGLYIYIHMYICPRVISIPVSLLFLDGRGYQSSSLVQNMSLLISCNVSMLNQDVKIEISPCWTGLWWISLNWTRFGGDQSWCKCMINLKDFHLIVHSDNPCTFGSRTLARLFEVGSIMPWVLPVMVTNQRL